MDAKREDGASNEAGRPPKYECGRGAKHKGPRIGSDAAYRLALRDTLDDQGWILAQATVLVEPEAEGDQRGANVIDETGTAFMLVP